MSRNRRERPSLFESDEPRESNSKKDIGNLPFRLMWLSRNLAHVLRHGAEKKKVSLEGPERWARLGQILILPGFSNHSEADVEEVVQESYSGDQPRFEIKRDPSGDYWIRATHKHTLSSISPFVPSPDFDGELPDLPALPSFADRQKNFRQRREIYRGDNWGNQAEQQHDQGEVVPFPASSEPDPWHSGKNADPWANGQCSKTEEDEESKELPAAQPQKLKHEIVSQVEAKVESKLPCKPEGRSVKFAADMSEVPTPSRHRGELPVGSARPPRVSSRLTVDVPARPDEWDNCSSPPTPPPPSVGPGEAWDNTETRPLIASEPASQEVGKPRGRPPPPPPLSLPVDPLSRFAAANGKSLQKGIPVPPEAVKIGQLALPSPPPPTDPSNSGSRGSFAETGLQTNAQVKWEQYASEDGDHPWWWCEATGDWFAEANAGPWHNFAEPDTSRSYWWKSDSEWFWTHTGSTLP